MMINNNDDFLKKKKFDMNPTIIDIACIKACPAVMQ